MNDIIVVALISGLFTLLGSFVGVIVSAKLTNYRIEQLEKKVEKHNSTVERTFKLEGQVTEIQHEIADIKKEIA